MSRELGELRTNGFRDGGLGYSNGVGKPDHTPLIGIIDDDPRSIRSIKILLEAANYSSVSAMVGKDAVALVAVENPDLLILEDFLPGKISSIEVLETVREFSSVPIIFLGSDKTGHREFKVLEAGADDYLVKPFGGRELVARVRAILRRVTFDLERQESAIFTNGELTVDQSQHLVMLRGEEVPLTPIEYGILAHLAMNVGRVVPSEDIVSSVWGPAFEASYGGKYPERHLVRSNVGRLRVKLGENLKDPRFIVTYKDVGYMMPNLNGDQALLSNGMPDKIQSITHP